MSDYKIEDLESLLQDGYYIHKTETEVAKNSAGQPTGIKFSLNLAKNVTRITGYIEEVQETKDE